MALDCDAGRSRPRDGSSVLGSRGLDDRHWDDRTEDSRLRADRRAPGGWHWGAVYLRVRVDGGFEQRAAVKLLPMGMDTPVARWRFHEERRHLDALCHPSIAQMYAGWGEPRTGPTYLIMEFVDGRPLDQFCDDKRLTVRQSLELFRGVCASFSATPMSHLGRRPRPEALERPHHRRGPTQASGLRNRLGARRDVSAPLRRPVTRQGPAFIDVVLQSGAALKPEQMRYGLHGHQVRSHRTGRPSKQRSSGSPRSPRP